jgi:CTP:molybdopterin cytidylyltransferase MocA
MKAKESFSVVIPAAGNSSRMNFPKPFLYFDNNRYFIEKILDTYIAAGIEQIILIIHAGIEKKIRFIFSGNYRYQKIKLVINRFPERGRFFSIQSGLKNISCRFCFIQNIDSPFITPVLLRKMMKEINHAVYVIPACTHQEGHPVLLGDEIIRHLLSLKGNDHNLRTELKCFSKNKVYWPYEEILANINTPEEYRKYFAKTMQEKNIGIPEKKWE